MAYSHRVCYLVFVAFVAVFVALYPYLDAGGVCDQGGCPDALQAPHEVPHAPMMYAAAVLAPLATAADLSAAFRRRRIEAATCPAEWRVAPEPHPPRYSF